MDIIGQLSIPNCARQLTSRKPNYPRPKGMSHLILLGSGCRAGSPKEDEIAQMLSKSGPSDIMGPGVDYDIAPNLLESYHDQKKVRNIVYLELSSRPDLFF
jgi:hypothetical protein